MPPLRLAGPDAATATPAPPVPVEPPQPDSLARIFYNEGKELLRSRQYAEAAAKLQLAADRAAVENLPFDEQALMHYVLGLALSRAERVAPAVAALKRALELNPTDAECRLELAQLLLQQRSYVDAEREATEALRLGLADAADQQTARNLVGVAQSRRLYAEGKELLKTRKSAAAASKLQAAIAKAREFNLPGEEQALMLYLLGLALGRIDRDEEAAAAFRESLRLSPNDAEVRLELAQVLLRSDKFDDARREGELALRGGLSDVDDRKDASALIKESKIERLRERFSADVSVSIGYDSNVLQSQRSVTVGQKNITAAARGTVSPPGQQTTTVDETRAGYQDLAKSLYNNYADTLKNIYTFPLEAPPEGDLPITLEFNILGRLLKYKNFETWTGVRYFGYFMAFPKYIRNPNEQCTNPRMLPVPCPPNHDAYNWQELWVPLQLLWKPLRFLQLSVNLRGWVTFTGAKDIEAYQGGFVGGLDATFIEGPRFRTLLSYDHNLARSFSADLAYANVDRDTVRLTQEFRTSFSRFQLRLLAGYRFRSYRSGNVTVSVPFSPAAVAADMSILFECNPSASTRSEIPFGCYIYNMDLSYTSHEISAAMRLKFPFGIGLRTGFSYEYLIYPNAYTASFDNLKTTAVMIDRLPRQLPPPGAQDPLPLPDQLRRDQLITVDLALRKELPIGFRVELNYIFVINNSTIRNIVDDRNYTKHTLNLTAAYSF